MNRKDLFLHTFCILLPIGIGIALLTVFPKQGMTQDRPELVVTSGHSTNITCLDYSPDGRYLASGADDNLVKVWDLSLQMEFRTLIGMKGGLRFIRFSPDGKKLAALDSESNLMVWSHPAGEILKNEKQEDLTLAIGLVWESGVPRGISYYPAPEGMTFAAGMDDAFTRDGSLMADSDMKGEVIVYDMKTKTPRCTISTGLGALFGCAISEDGKKLIACGLQSGKMFDITTKKLIKEIKDIRTYDHKLPVLASLLNTAAFSQDGESFALGATMTENQSEKGDIVTGYHIILYETSSFKRQQVLRGSPHLPTAIGVCSAGNMMLTSALSFPQGCKTWDLKDGSVSRFIAGYGEMLTTPDGRFAMFHEYVAPDNHGELKIVSLPSFEIVYMMKVSGVGRMAISADGTRAAYVVSASTAGGLVNTLYTVDITAAKQISSLKVPLEELGGYFFMTPDGKYVMQMNNSISLRETANLATKKVIEINREGYDNFPYQMAFSPDGKSFSLARVSFDKPSSVIWMDMMTGQASSEFSVGASGLITSVVLNPEKTLMAVGIMNLLDAKPYKVIVVDIASGAIKCTLDGHLNVIMRSAFGQDGKSLFSGEANGVIKYWDLERCAERTSFIAMGDLDYIITNPASYYKASSQGLMGVGFRYKNKLYSYDQFDLKFNRPDLVMASMGISKIQVKLLYSAYAKRLKRFGFTPEQMEGETNLPEMEIIGKYDLPLTLATGDLKIKLKASDAAIALTRLHVYVNDVPLYGTRGLDIGATKSKTLDKEITIPLSTGRNRVQIAVQNESGLQSARESFEITCTRVAVLPTLYVLAAGVSEFKDSERNLKYAVKDVNDFTAMLATGKQYKEIKVTKLLNGQVTKDAILEAGKALQSAGVDDVVVIYISSHGLLDAGMDYFLAMHDVNFDDPAVLGLPYDAIEEMLDPVKARQRLVLIDACHSGEVDKESMEVTDAAPMSGGVTATAKSGSRTVQPKAGLNNSFEYMKALFTDVSKGSGATVISAAGGMEFALESGEWNNGVFTYSMMSGLKTKAADLNGDGKIYISELKDYTSDKVRQLTSGAQNPTTRRVNLFGDFRFW